MASYVVGRSIVPVAGKKREDQDTSKTPQDTIDPVDIREMPSPIGVPIKNVIKKSVPLSSA